MKINFKLAFSAFIILTFLIQVQSSQPVLAQDNSGFPQVDLGSGFKPNEINFAYKFYNSSLASNYTGVITTLDQQFANASSLDSSISTSTIKDAQVVTIFGSSTAATSDEVDAVRTSVNNGRGLLYLAGSNNVSKSAEQFFKDFFGVEMINFTSNEILGSTYSGTTHYVIATEFNSPSTPVTENITKLVLPHTIGINVNYTAMAETNVTIKDIYPIIYDSFNQNTLGLAIEVGDFGRIIILGSQEVFSNNFYANDGIYTNMTGINNKLFASNVITWLGRGSGYFHMLGHSLNIEPLQFINRKDIVNGTVELTNEYNNSFTNAEVKFAIEIPNVILDYNYMNYVGNNTYYGSISTRNAYTGYYVEFHAKIEKRGYVVENFALSRVYVKLEFSGPSLPDLSMITILSAGIIIFGLSSFYLWKEFRKLNL